MTLKDKRNQVLGKNIYEEEDVAKAIKELKEKISKLNRREDLELSYIDEIFGVFEK